MLDTKFVSATMCPRLPGPLILIFGVLEGGQAGRRAGGQAII